MEEIYGPARGSDDSVIHYTTREGLLGILSSKCFHASEVAYLNDTSEGTIFAETRFIEIFQKAAKKNARLAAHYGDGTALAHGVIRAQGLFNQFIASFSRVPEGDPQVRFNGLLSQWRAYGSGYAAVVLDRSKLEARMRQEYERVAFAKLLATDVRYTLPKKLAGDSNDPDITKLELDVFEALLKFPRQSALGDLAELVTTLQFIYKHGGFQEEYEYRCCALVGARLDEHNDYAHRDNRKPVEILRKEGSNTARYIEICTEGLQEDARSPLPVNQIIVGPSRDAHARAESLRRDLERLGSQDLGSLVVVSNIPYAG